MTAVPAGAVRAAAVRVAAVRVAADVGGTFTDVVVDAGDGAVVALKVPSTPDGFERGVLQGMAAVLGRAAVPAGALGHVLHATTAGTNAVLERSGPPTALVTTRGFRDVLEIGRLRTPTIYDLAWRKPPPLVPRHLRLEVDERIGADGDVVTPVDVGPLAGPLDDAVRGGVVSVAVSLVNAHAAPVHERLVADFVRRRHPGVLVTAGTDVVREIGEFERTSTAVVNAYLRPVISAYLDRLVAGLAELGSEAPVLVMQSGGGMMPAAAAAALPAHLVESGPAAGVLAAAHVARTTGDRRAISFDMGGTTAKASLIEDFTPQRSNELSVGSELSAASRLLRGAGYAVRLPVVDLAEVGAGGGSIARVDAGGALRVGPQSAGADPGPACYGRGGTAATVTDANLLLGLVSERHLVASGAGADAGLAAAALARDVAGPLGLTVPEAALAVHRVANQQMARVLRAVTTERGRTVGEYTLVAFGGGGGIHAASLASAVGIRRVVVPPLAGVLSAVGLLQAPVELSVTETVGLPLGDDTVAAIGATVARLAAEQRSVLDSTLQAVPGEDGGAGAAVTEVLVDVDVRYPGEASELTLALPDAVLDARAAAELADRFHERHLAEFGHGSQGAVEVVRVRATARRRVGERQRLGPGHAGTPGTPGSPGIPGHVGHAGPPGAPAAPAADGADEVRVASFDGRPHEVPVVGRSALRGAGCAGPLLVDEADTTVVVPPGWSARCDASGNLLLEVAP